MPVPSRLITQPRIYITDAGDGPANPNPDDFKFNPATGSLRLMGDQGAWKGIGSPFVAPGVVPTQEATVGAATYTTAQILAGLIDRDPNGAARSDVTPTALQIIANCGLEQNGDMVWCFFVNTADAAEAVTITGGVGVTVVNGGQTIAQSESAILVFQRVTATTVKCYIIGA
jgi:hypothetical protein